MSRRLAALKRRSVALARRLIVERLERRQMLASDIDSSWESFAFESHDAPWSDTAFFSMSSSRGPLNSQAFGGSSDESTAADCDDVWDGVPDETSHDFFDAGTTASGEPDMWEDVGAGDHHFGRDPFDHFDPPALGHRPGHNHAPPVRRPAGEPDFGDIAAPPRTDLPSTGRPVPGVGGALNGTVSHPGNSTTTSPSSNAESTVPSRPRAPLSTEVEVPDHPSSGTSTTQSPSETRTQVSLRDFSTAGLGSDIGSFTTPRAPLSETAGVGDSAPAAGINAGQVTATPFTATTSFGSTNTTGSETMTPRVNNDAVSSSYAPNMIELRTNDPANRDVAVAERTETTRDTGSELHDLLRQLTEENRTQGHSASKSQALSRGRDPSKVDPATASNPLTGMIALQMPTSDLQLSNLMQLDIADAPQPIASITSLVADIGLYQAFEISGIGPSAAYADEISSVTKQDSRDASDAPKPSPVVFALATLASPVTLIPSCLPCQACTTGSNHERSVHLV